jgi:hypothetical protein
LYSILISFSRTRKNPPRQNSQKPAEPAKPAKPAKPVKPRNEPVET